MSQIRSIPLNGTWGDALKVQTDAGNFNPIDMLNGVPGYMEWVNDPLGQRGLVLKSSVDGFTSPTPGNPAGSNGNRSELYTAYEPVVAGTPVERWYCWDMLFTDEFVANDRYFCIMQIHDNPADGAAGRWPPLMMWAGMGEILVQLPAQHPPTENVSKRTAGAYPLIRNRWIPVVVRVKLSLETSGFFETYIDKKLVVKEHLHGTSYNDATGPHFKLGIYNTFKHTGSGKIAKAYYSNVRQFSTGDSYSAVMGAIEVGSMLLVP